LEGGVNGRLRRRRRGSSLRRWCMSGCSNTFMNIKEGARSCVHWTGGKGLYHGFNS
jgi:hypothetical protein